MKQLTPLYRKSDQIYGENDSVNFPYALIRKVGEKPGQKLIRNPATRQELWVPNSVFSFHWHVLSAAEMQIFLIVPDEWAKKKHTFFKQKRLL